MTKEKFEKFLEEKAAAVQPQEPFDWNARKQTWLARLKEFYAKLEEYLTPYITSRKLSVTYSPLSIYEEELGTYDVKKMTLRIGSDEVVLEPIGTILFGASGRVDMIGPRGSVKFILTGKRSNGIRLSVRISDKKKPFSAPPAKSEPPEEQVWKIATPPPKVRFIELGPEPFFDALTEVVDG